MDELDSYYMAVFRKSSTYDQYAKELKTNRLNQTGMGGSWLNAAVGATRD